MLAESDSHLLAVQQIHRQMATICQTAAEADFLDAQNGQISQILDISKNYMRGIIAGERDPLKHANSSPLSCAYAATDLPRQIYEAPQPDIQPIGAQRQVTNVVFAAEDSN